MQNKIYDTLIIGAGIVGCSVARYLSKYKGDIAVLERYEDVCCGTSKANSGIVHAGFDAKHGTLMAKYNVEGSRMYPKLAQELDIKYRNNGSIVLCLSEEDRPKLISLYENGISNDVEGLRIITRDELLTLEPNVSDEAVCALYAPTGGIVCPFDATFAMAENAAHNGAEFYFDTNVTVIVREDALWKIMTSNGTYLTRTVVNAAGCYSDVFHNMVSSKMIRITPRRGEYLLLDRTAGDHVSHTVFRLPGKMGKGVLITPTVHGNILVGPTAEDIEDKDDVSTTAEGLDKIRHQSSLSIKDLPLNKTITSFAGLRSHEDGHEFIIGEAEDAEGFFDCAGIESPGLSAAPAIGADVAEMIAYKLDLQEKEDFDPYRTGITDPFALSEDSLNELIRVRPDYGRIVCRCESITEGQIRDAIRCVPGARSLDGVKRRIRAGMGRCQGGFCSPAVMEIIADELQMDISDVTKKGKGSRIIVGEDKAL
jgi:glycerol-3-phosphate dehydrogenase